MISAPDTIRVFIPLTIRPRQWAAAHCRQPTWKLQSRGPKTQADSHPFRSNGQNSANEGCSPIVLSIT